MQGERTITDAQRQQQYDEQKKDSSVKRVDKIVAPTRIRKQPKWRKQLTKLIGSRRRARTYDNHYSDSQSDYEDSEEQDDDSMGSFIVSDSQSDYEDIEEQDDSMDQSEDMRMDIESDGWSTDSIVSRQISEFQSDVEDDYYEVGEDSQETMDQQ